MGYQTGVLEALNDYGVRYIETPGCRTRGYSSFWPAGFVEHHDAIPSRWTALPGIFIDGRSDLAGALCNFANNAAGTVYVVALGAANHAGAGSWRGVYGNSKVWGLEQQNAGDDAQVYPDEQIESTVRLTAACADFSGFGAEMVCRHAEWAPTRKIDPRGPWEDGHRWQYDMSHFRAMVAAGGTGDEMTDAEWKKLATWMQDQTKNVIGAIDAMGLATTEQTRHQEQVTREVVLDVVDAVAAESKLDPAKIRARLTPKTKAILNRVD